MLYLLCGPPFSGKSTVARALEARGVVRVALDDILTDRGLDPGSGLPPDAWESASHEACSRIAAEHEAGHDVVLDDTLCFRFLRDRYRALARRHAIPYRLIVLRIDPREVRRRVAENERTQMRPPIRSEVLEQHLATFEWPGEDEPAIDLDAAETTEHHLETLGL